MQPSRIHHVGLPVSDLDLGVARYCEALGLTHESTAGVPEGVGLHGRADGRAARAARSGCSALCLGRADRGATRRRPPTQPGRSMTSTRPRACGGRGRPLGLDAPRHARARIEDRVRR
jgi:catechol 2,3-dioxygenase-like lactoylglutathione lyase family enzyme